MFFTTNVIPPYHTEEKWLPRWINSGIIAMLICCFTKICYQLICCGLNFHEQESVSSNNSEKLFQGCHLAYQAFSLLPPALSESVAQWCVFLFLLATNLFYQSPVSTKLHSPKARVVCVCGRLCVLRCFSQSLPVGFTWQKWYQTNFPFSCLSSLVCVGLPIALYEKMHWSWHCGTVYTFRLRTCYLRARAI